MRKVLIAFCFLFIGFASNAQEFGDSAVLNERIFHGVEQTARFPGGTKEFYKYVAANLKLPRKEIYTTAEHYVVLELVISPEGRIAYGKVKKGMGKPFDKAVIDLVLNIPQWEPGKQNGRPVYSYLFLPIVFLE